MIIYQAQQPFLLLCEMTKHCAIAHSRLLFFAMLKSRINPLVVGDLKGICDYIADDKEEYSETQGTIPKMVCADNQFTFVYDF